MSYITNEIAYKLGWYDAYFMGAEDTVRDGWDDVLLELYAKGYQSGTDEYARLNPESAA